MESGEVLYIIIVPNFQIVMLIKMCRKAQHWL